MVLFRYLNRNLAKKPQKCRLFCFLIGVTADKAAITALLLADKAAKKFSPRFFFFLGSVADFFGEGSERLASGPPLASRGGYAKTVGHHRIGRRGAKRPDHLLKLKKLLQFFFFYAILKE
jgi:hypothetical protein